MLSALVLFGVADYLLAASRLRQNSMKLSLISSRSGVSSLRQPCTTDGVIWSYDALPAVAIEHVMQPMVSESPPIEIARRRAALALVRCKNAIMAIGTLPWQLTSNLYCSRIVSSFILRLYPKVFSTYSLISLRVLPWRFRYMQAAMACAPLMPSVWLCVTAADLRASSNASSSDAAYSPTGLTRMPEPLP